MIPKIIHQIYQTRNGQPIPRRVLEWVKRCATINTEYQHIFWKDEKNINSFILDNFYQYYTAYKMLPNDVQRWDLLRLMILYLYGGIYIDTDVEMYKAIDENVLHDDDKCVFALEPEQHAFDYERMPYLIGTYFIACERENEFIRLLIDRIMKTVNINRSVHIPTQIMKSTGGVRVTEIYREERQAYDVKLLPSDYFSPLTAKECKKYVFGKYFAKAEQAYGQHIYAGSWVDDAENKDEIELLNFIKTKNNEKF